MKYILVYTNRAIRDIEKPDPKVKNRIGETLLRYAEGPLAYAVRLKDSRLGTYRFRIGDNRVIFDIEDDDIVILRVGLRKDIYRG
jgi:mRNA interferase RelE/StbE